MAKRRYILDSYWTDSWIENLDPIEKLVYLYLLTNPNVSICGIYEIQIKRMAFETGIDKEMIEKILKRFQEQGKIYYKNNLLFIINFVKNQNINSESDNLWRGIVREIGEIREKLDDMLQDKGLIRTLQGAYKVVPIPYLTLLNLTLPIGEDQKEKKITKELGPTREENIEQIKNKQDIIDCLGEDLILYEKGGLAFIFGMIKTGYILKKSKKDIKELYERAKDTLKLNGFVDGLGNIQWDLGQNRIGAMSDWCESKGIEQVPNGYKNRLRKFLSKK